LAERQSAVKNRSLEIRYWKCDCPGHLGHWMEKYWQGMVYLCCR